MIPISFFTGGIPATSKIESEEAALLKDYKDYNEYLTSDELKRYEELDSRITASEFSARVKEIKAQKFKDTGEYKKEQEFLALRKSKDIKTYFKVLDSKELANLNQVDGSEKLLKYEKLAQYVNSGEFRNLKGGKEFKNSEAAGKEQEFNQLKKDPAIKYYFKFRNSSKYQAYSNVKGSDRLSKLEELEKFVQSEEFKKLKDYMSLSGGKKYEQSEEYKLQQEYQELKKSEKIIWFYKLKKKNQFEKVTDWKLTFEDDFNSGSLDSSKWMTRYYWGDVLLQDTYSLPGDKHFYTDGKNLEISDSVLKIITKKETTSGKAWNPVTGFILQEFNYTSGLISTGKSFRQKYGKFKVKARMSGAPLRQSVSLLGEQIMPHIDLAKLQNGKLTLGHLWGNIAEKSGVKKKLYKKGGGKFSSDFYIFSLEWTPEKMVWKINDKEVLSQANTVPQDPMYLLLGAGISGEFPDSQLPAKMEIDWVKVYKKAGKE